MTDIGFIPEGLMELLKDPNIIDIKLFGEKEKIKYKLVNKTIKEVDSFFSSEEEYNNFLKKINKVNEKSSPINIFTNDDFLKDYYFYLKICITADYLNENKRSFCSFRKLYKTNNN